MRTRSLSPLVGIRGHRILNPERAEERRREILLAGAHVLARLGYNRATLADVALQLGASKAVIYYHFRSKEELFTEIRATAIRDAIERLEVILGRGDPPEVTLRTVVIDLVSHIFDELDRYANVLRPEHGVSEHSRITVRSLQRQYEQLICGVVQDGIRQGVFADRDPKVTTFVLLRACLGVADWGSPDGPLPPWVIAEQISDQVVSGLLLRDAASVRRSRRPRARQSPPGLGRALD